MLQTLNDYFSNFLIDGIFSNLQKLDVPWKDENISADLDLMYHANNSGNKNVSMVIRTIAEDEPLTTEQRETLARTLFTLNNKRWLKLWGVYSLEYNPIENYRMVETETIDGTNATDTTEQGNTSDTLNSSSELNNTLDTSIYGFNSVSSVNSDRNVTTGDNTQSSNGYSDYQNTTGRTGENHTQRELTRSGNIGVTTSQQMAQSEIDLWKWDFFKNVVFPDLDSGLTIKIY